MLSADELRSIIQAVLVDKLSYEEVALKYNVKPKLVNSLLSQYKKNDGFLQLHI
jgi:transposase-like protein